MLQPHYTTNQIEAGCDEAGRGCLAGPVFAAAVILPSDFYHPKLNDSKKVSEKNRIELRDFIEKNAINWSVAFIDNYEIDKINILNASILAMHKALDKLTTRPEFILVDGNRFKKYENIKHQCIIEGDANFMSIAAASILAKTYRDEFMYKIHEKYPQYNWKKNKGYPTKEHRLAIKTFGTTPFHRLSFNLKGNTMESVQLTFF